MSSQTAVEPITDEQFKQVVGLLQLVRTSCSRMPEASALFMDELCNVISNGQLDPKVEVSACMLSLRVMIVVSVIWHKMKLDL